MAIIQGNAKQGSTRGFYPKVINGSLRFNKLDNAYLEYDITTTGDPKTWTFSCWFKICTIAIDPWYPRLFDVAPAATANKRTIISVHLESVGFQYYDGSTNYSMSFPHKYRDPSAWYHMVFVYDSRSTTTSTDRLRMYINGERLTPSSVTYPSDNFNSFANTSGNVMRLGNGVNDDGYDRNLDAYMANVHFIDGQALTASDFGETKNGVWVAKDYAGTFGTNGFYLTFEDDTQVEAFNTVLYRGTGSELSVTGTGFTPDLVWCKRRDSTPSHSLQDSVRGPRGRLFSDTTAAEDQNSGVISFDSDGFTIDGTKNATGSNGSSYVAWCWDAGANNAVTGHSSVTYTGSSSTQKISGFPFRPDLVWIKGRSDAYSSRIFDSVRGADKVLVSDTTAAEFDGGGTTYFTSFDSDGFNLTGNISVNGSSKTYVAWAWDAGDGDPVSNTDGSITSTVKASQANGFSIVSYTGNSSAATTVGHGLSAAPDFFIVKNRIDATNWIVWHKDLSANQWLKLETTDSAFTNADAFGAVPSSTTITLGSFNSTNGSSDNMICYAWHDVTGKQKFGSYTGDGTSDGSLAITTGFRVGWLMIKRTDSAHDWSIIDASRSPFNPTTKELLANTSDSEATAQRVNFTDTGFELMNAGGRVNANGGTYIYAAFAGSYSDYITDYNTDGSIDSRVKASDTTGFSIVSYTGNGSSTGATVGHGLSSAPSMIVFKNRDSALNWDVYHTSIGATNRLHLNTTNASATTDGFYNTAPTTSVFTVNYGSANVNAPSASYIAYCWSETTGYSKFGSYTGTGSAGLSITGLGFKPSLLLIKNTSTATNWIMHDSTRDVANPITNNLYANLSNAEETNTTLTRIDFDSDGFTLQNTSSWAESNASGNTYIYAAFADTREAAFWLDQSGNDNDWQPVNLDHNDTVADSPTNNFATLNPLNSSASATLSDGNLKHYNTANDQASTATFAISSGKWYWEVTTDDGAEIGLIPVNQSLAGLSTVGAGSYAQLAVITNGTTMRTPAWATTNTTGLSAQTGTFGVVVDADAGKMWVTDGSGNYVNSGNPTTGANPQATFDADWLAQTGGGVVPYALLATGIGAEMVFNFGQQPFKYDPPA